MASPARADAPHAVRDRRVGRLALLRRTPRLTALSTGSVAIELIASAASSCPELASLACDAAVPRPCQLRGIARVAGVTGAVAPRGAAPASATPLLEMIHALPDTHPLERGRIGSEDFDRTSRR